MVNSRLFKRFISIYSEKNNIQSFKNYYQSLCNWIDSNKKMIGSELISRTYLDKMMSLDLDEYLVDPITNGLCLEKEAKRMIKEYSNIESLLRSIFYTLWDMVTISSDSDCSNCGKDGDLRYIKINNGKVVLECNECGYVQNLDGSKVEEKIENFLPATKSEVELAISNNSRAFS